MCVCVHVGGEGARSILPVKTISIFCKDANFCEEKTVLRIGCINILRPHFSPKAVHPPLKTMGRFYGWRGNRKCV